MQQRLCGKEQEYGMRIRPYRVFPKLPPPDLLTPEEAIRYLKDNFSEWRRGFASAIIRNIGNLPFPVFDKYSSERIWLGNGSLVYIDLHCILEFATAEYRACSLEGVLQEKASEALLNDAIKLAVAEKGIDSLILYKNNIGPSGDGDIYDEVAYASHHNYSYLAAKQFEVFAILKNFVPASLILSGNGHVYKHQSGNILYSLSQRAPHIVTLENYETRYNRPIINTRHESLMDQSTGLNRLHLISRDATRCEFQTWLVDGVTHLILRLAEEVNDKKELPPNLSDPVSELQNINLSLGNNLDYKVRLGWSLLGIISTGTMDLIEYNYLFLNLAKQLNPLSAEEKLCLQEWERVLELLKARAFDKLVGELDWVTKRWLIEKKMSKYNFGLNDVRAWKIDMGYHDISTDPKQSWFALLEEEGRIKHLITKEDIKRAVYTPPETRAKSRGKLVRLAWENNKVREKIHWINWDAVVVKNNPSWFGRASSPQHFFGERKDPFATISPELENLYKELGIEAE